MLKRIRVFGLLETTQNRNTTDCIWRLTQPSPSFACFDLNFWQLTDTTTGTGRWINIPHVDNFVSQVIIYLAGLFLLSQDAWHAERQYCIIIDLFITTISGLLAAVVLAMMIDQSLWAWYDLCREPLRADISDLAAWLCLWLLTPLAR